MNKTINDQEQHYSFILQQEESGQRLDKWLQSQLPDMTRSAIQKLIEQGNVTRNGTAISKNGKGNTGDVIEVTVPQPKKLEVTAQDIPLEILYEDDDLLVVNKPKGMVVHPAAGNDDGTLVNALLHHCGESLSGINGIIRPGIVHRIDKDTSGLLIVAKNDVAHQGLAQQIKEHSFTRIYEAVVYGNVKQEEGTVDAPIGRHPTDRKRMAVTDKNSRNAVTHYKVLKRYDGFTHVQLRLETGRTHQIRVHMAYIGHPVAGDPVYGVKKVITALNGQCLHARVIGFVHPVTEKYIEITSELPAYFTDFLSKLKEQ